MKYSLPLGKMPLSRRDVTSFQVSLEHYFLIFAASC